MRGPLLGCVLLSVAACGSKTAIRDDQPADARAADALALDTLSDDTVSADVSLSDLVDRVDRDVRTEPDAQALPDVASAPDAGGAPLFLTVSESLPPQVVSRASFFTVNATSGERCYVEDFDGCFLRDCRPPFADVGHLGSGLPGINAGEVHVHGTAPGTADLVLTPRTGGTYLPAMQMGRLGMDFLVDGLGGIDQGPFHVALSLPPPLRGVSPMVGDPMNDVYNIPRDVDLAVVWAPTMDLVVVNLGQRAFTGTSPTWLEDLTAQCFFDGAAGTARVPVAVLQRFESLRAGNSSGSLSISSARRVVQPIGTHTLSTVATGGGAFMRAQFD